MSEKAVLTPASENRATASEAAEDDADRLAVQDFRCRLAAGEEE